MLTMKMNGYDITITKRPGNTLEWNAAVSSFEEGSFFQSTHWGDFLQLYMGSDTYYVSVKKGDETVGISLVWVEHKKIGKLSLMSKAYCFHGPLIRGYSDKHIGIFMDIFNRIMRENGIVYFEQLSLPIHFDGMAKNGLFVDGAFFGRYGYAKHAWGTIVVDLRQEEDRLRENINHAAKKSLHKNQKDGIEVALLKDAGDCRKYCDMFDVFQKNSAVKIPYFSFDMWDFLGNREKCMEVFVAMQKGAVLGGICAIFFNGIVFEMAAWRSEHAVKNNLCVGDALKWGVIEWAKRNGNRLYDLTGISPNPASDKEKGIRRFKEKWGGVVVTYPYYSKVYNKGIYGLYNLVRSMRDVVMAQG